MRSVLSRVGRHVTYANVVATIALLSAIGGTAWAAGIGSGGIIDESILSRDIKNGTLKSLDIANGGIEAYDLSARARASLKGQKGDPGVQGIQGIQGVAGTSIDSMLDLEGAACQSAGGNEGVVDVVFGAATSGFASITLRCDLDPIDCGVMPSVNNVSTYVCNGTVGEWEIDECAAGFVDTNGQFADGCEFMLNYTVGDCRAPDGSIDNSDVPTNPYPVEQIVSCSHGNPVIICQSVPIADPDYVWQGMCYDHRLDL